jgi:peptide/nickel transport system substrate-binding protein
VKLRQGVKWHDGAPFTARDVQCTWHRLIEKEPGYFRRNLRRIWYRNLIEVTTEGDHEAVFHLAKPQPSFLALLASAYAPVYPCHVGAQEMRTRPIGTGPFKLAEFKSNEAVRLIRNENYWRAGRPYLDGITMSIIPVRATRILGLIAKEFDLTTAGDVTVPLMGDIAAKAPEISCTFGPTAVSVHVLLNRTRAPFDNPDLRRAVMLALDRQAFIDILAHGKADISGAMMPPPEGVWGMPREKLASLTGYGGSPGDRLAEARRIMETLGYGPSNKLVMKVSTRDLEVFRNPAVILADQLNRIHFQTELEIVDSSAWVSRVMSKMEYSITLNLSGSAVDDPDVTLVENFACGSNMNASKYCSDEVEQLLITQSHERDQEKRRAIVWEIEKKLADDVARPMIMHGRAAQCWQPYVKGYIRHENSLYNNWRLDHVWLDK